MVDSTSDEMPVPRVRNKRIHLVEEHNDRNTLIRLLLGTLEDQPYLPLRLADVLVEELGALDVQEVGTGVLAALLLGHSSSPGCSLLLWR